MPVDREADHLQIKALTECLSFPLKLVYVDRSEGGPTELVIPDGSSPDVSLLYRPGFLFDKQSFSLQIHFTEYRIFD